MSSAAVALDVSLQELAGLKQQAALINLQQLARGRLAAAEGRVMNQPGRGLDFREVRAYQPGDDPRYLDWKITARRGQAYTRTYEAEHQRPVALFVDQTSQMQFGALASKAVLAARLAALLGWAALHEGEKIGGWIETDQGGWWEKPVAGPQYFLKWLARLAACNQQLGELQPQAPGRLDAALEAFRQRLPRNSLVILISDFRGWQDRRLLEVMASKMPLVAIQLTDPLDAELPDLDAAVDLGGDRHWLNAELRHQWRAGFQHTQNELRQALGHRGRYLGISTRQQDQLLACLLPTNNRNPAINKVKSYSL